MDLLTYPEHSPSLAVAETKKPVSKWMCDRCDKLHDNKSAAEECCPPTINEVFLCPKCSGIHDDPFAAMSCCGSSEADIPETFHKIPAATDPATYISAFCVINGLKP